MKSVKFPNEMASQVRQLLLEQNVVQMKLQNYLLGCMHGLGLKGDWNANLDKLQFEYMVKAKANTKVPNTDSPVTKEA